MPISNVKVSLDSEDATGGKDCAPVSDGGGEESCCTGGSASGSCICSNNVAAGVTLRDAAAAQTILGRRAALFSRSGADPVRAKQARVHQPSKTVSSEMFPGYYSTWVRTSSSSVSIPVITPVTPPTWSGAWSETMTTTSERPPNSVTTPGPDTTTSSSTLSTETPITTTISIIASSLTRSSSSSTASTSLSVPTVIPTFPDGASSPDTSPTEAATSSLATKLGLGLGIPSVVLVVAFITVCVYRRQRRLRYAQAPPFDFNAPEMAPVSAADFAPAANYRAHFPPHRSSRDAYHHHPEHQQQAHRYGPPRASRPWSEWGPGAAWTETRATAWVGDRGGGRGSLDDNQVGFVDRSLGDGQGYYYSGTRRDMMPEPAPGYEDLGSPYEDRGRDTYQVPVVQVHGPQQWTSVPTAGGGDLDPDRAQEQGLGQGQGQGRGYEYPPRRDLARVSRGLSVNEEVSPLSSTGSGVPYPRMSAISGMGGWEKANPRVSRG